MRLSALNFAYKFIFADGLYLHAITFDKRRWFSAAARLLKNAGASEVKTLDLFFKQPYKRHCAVGLGEIVI